MRGGCKKRKRRVEEEVKEHRKANKKVQKALNEAEEDWIGTQCKKTDACLNRNNSKNAAG